MSNAAIEQVISALQKLPDSAVERVLEYVDALRQQHGARAEETESQSNTPAIKEIEGILVFTGKIGDPNIDWLEVVRRERDEEIFHCGSRSLPCE